MHKRLCLFSLVLFTGILYAGTSSENDMQLIIHKLVNQHRMNFFVADTIGKDLKRDIEQNEEAIIYNAKKYYDSLSFDEKINLIIVLSAIAVKITF